MPLSYPTAELARISRARAGPLAFELGRISSALAPLPGICLTTTAYRRHLRRAGILLPELTTPAALDRWAARAVTAVLETPVEPALLRAIAAAGCATEWVVRASSEDGALFEQRVRADERVRAVCAAWAGPWRPSAVRDRMRAGHPFAPGPLAVLLQRAPARVGARGILRPLAGGWRLVVEEGSLEPGTAAGLLRRAERLSAPVPEIEWVLAGRRFYAIEAREPVASEVRGVGASPGTATGIVRVVRTARDARSIGAGTILVSAYLLPALTACIPRVAGIVVESGGSTSHLAVVARQFGIPAVLGARGVLDSMRDGDRVTLDGTGGMVRVERS
jgi:phosphoenolpyruvate synthase/pyruvate phosphate dikinase